MDHVKKWLDVILPVIKPLLYSEGGPVIMVQVSKIFNLLIPVIFHSKILYVQEGFSNFDSTLTL